MNKVGQILENFILKPMIQNTISTELFKKLKKQAKDVTLLELPLMSIFLLQIFQAFFCEDDDRKLYKN